MHQRIYLYSLIASLVNFGMAKRFTPIRLEDKLRKSLDRFVEDWNRSGAPSTNRTFVITTAIEQYLKNWRPALKKTQAGSRGNSVRHANRVLDFPPSTAKRPIRNRQILRAAV